MSSQNQETESGETELRAEKARLIHDLRTPLFTIKNYAHQLPQASEVKIAIDRQIDKINQRLDEFWSEEDHLAPVPEKMVNNAAVDGLADTGNGGEVCDKHKALNILVVDDDKLIREIGRRILEHEGHRVITSASGSEALICCTAIEIDAVFTDLNMPGLTGLELAAAVSALNGSGARPVVIGMSNDPRVAETRAKCLAAGMDSYIEKPVTREKCLAALGSI